MTTRSREDVDHSPLQEISTLLTCPTTMAPKLNRTRNCEIHECIIDGQSMRRKFDSFKRAELEESAKDGCRICQLLLDALASFTDLKSHSTVTNDGQFSKRRYAIKTAAWTSRVLELYALPGAIACIPDPPIEAHSVFKAPVYRPP
jgi:hypothetical protein